MEKYLSLFERIRQSGDKYKQKKVIVEETKDITFESLLTNANAYACYLKTCYQKENEFVLVIAKSSIEVVTCILGVLQSGGAYVMMNPDAPEARIHAMIDDIKPSCIFYSDDNTIADVVGYTRCKLGSLMKELNDTNHSIQYIETKRQKDDIAYMVYTSGTTGTPSAVMTTDYNIISYISGYIKALKVTQEDIVIQQSPVYYDGYAEEIFTMLMVGGKIIIPNDATLRNPRLLLKCFNHYNITLVPTIPLILNELNKLPQANTVRAYVSSGAALKRADYDNVAKYTSVYNMYGPTETTVCATIYQCELKEEMYTPIGKPIMGYEVILVDENLQKSNRGELYIAGDGVSKGYFNNIEKTKEKYVTFDGRLYYKTGDIAYIDDNKVLHYVGRNDRQVKIRGNRIELDEIERLVYKVKGINQAVAMIPKGEDSQLYVIYTSDYILEEDVMNYCRNNLPAYMCPSYVLKINQIPIGNTGKINFDSLEKELTKRQTVTSLKHDILDEVGQRLMNTLAPDVKFLGTNQLSMDSKLIDIGFNSIQFISLAVNLECEFDIEFEDEMLDITKFFTISDLYNYICKLL